ncbi:hypothetical protein [Clostridium chromiireducens]|uniref:hypothetical protein n=1 Tax=Clostridium chromiireducens TaxID=225345 RepID=UPI0015FD5B5C|nr:hypothetical protein [Clostridium chromiireducens]
MKAIYRFNSQDDNSKFLDICEQHKLLITGGSDFHDFNTLNHSNRMDISLDK